MSELVNFDNAPFDLGNVEQRQLEHGDDEYPALTDKEEGRLSLHLDQKFGERTVEVFMDRHFNWKDGNGDGEALVDMALHEKAFIEGLDINANPRFEHKLNGDDLHDGEDELARYLAAVSQSFVERHHPDKFRVYRGFGYALPFLFRDMLDNPEDDSYELVASGLSNYTTDKETASQFGDAVVSWLATPDAIAFAADHLFKYNPKHRSEDGTEKAQGGETPEDVIGAHAELRVNTDEIPMINPDQVSVPATDTTLSVLAKTFGNAPQSLGAEEVDLVCGILEDMNGGKEDDSVNVPFREKDSLMKLVEWYNEYAESLELSSKLVVRLAGDDVDEEVLYDLQYEIGINIRDLEVNGS